MNVCVYVCVCEREGLCICVCKQTHLCVPVCVLEVYAFWMVCIPSKGETGTDASI